MVEKVQINWGRVKNIFESATERMGQNPDRPAIGAPKAKVCYPISPQRRMVFKYLIRKVFVSILDSCNNVLVFLMHETVSSIEVHQDDPPAAARRK